MATCKTETPAAVDVRDRMNIVIVGSVDHGKSTLLGRLYADTGTLPEGKVEKIQAICKQQGKEFEYAFLFDAFLEEQQQGVTIDTARTFFQWAGRQYIIIDAPGHKEFLKNMVSGAARAEAALLLIDALEGVKDQSKRHGLLLSMLGVRQVTVVVNKMDLVDYQQETFALIEKEYRAFLSQLDVTPQFVIPASAKRGDNIATPSPHMPWHTGPNGPGIAGAILLGIRKRRTTPAVSSAGRVQIRRPTDPDGPHHLRTPQSGRPGHLFAVEQKRGRANARSVQRGPAAHAGPGRAIRGDHPGRPDFCRARGDHQSRRVPCRSSPRPFAPTCSGSAAGPWT